MGSIHSGSYNAGVYNTQPHQANPGPKFGMARAQVHRTGSYLSSQVKGAFREFNPGEITLTNKGNGFSKEGATIDPIEIAAVTDDTLQEAGLQQVKQEVRDKNPFGLVRGEDDNTYAVTGTHLEHARNEHALARAVASNNDPATQLGLSPLEPPRVTSAQTPYIDPGIYKGPDGKLYVPDGVSGLTEIPQTTGKFEIPRLNHLKQTTIDNAFSAGKPQAEAAGNALQSATDLSTTIKPA